MTLRPLLRAWCWIVGHRWKMRGLNFTIHTAACLRCALYDSSLMYVIVWDGEPPARDEE